MNDHTEDEEHDRLAAENAELRKSVEALESRIVELKLGLADRIADVLKLESLFTEIEARGCKWRVQHGEQDPCSAPPLCPACLAATRHDKEPEA